MLPMMAYRPVSWKKQADEVSRRLNYLNASVVSICLYVY